MTHKALTLNAHDPYEVFVPFMKTSGATCSPKEFYWAVNEALHAAEATVYDSKHATMYVEAGGDVWKRLLSHLPDSPPKLRILDVGCGTGLVGHFIAVHVPDRVECLSLMDPSEKMIAVAKRKAASWPFDTAFLQCDIDALDVSESFDVVTINSVLHHVVELQAFVKRVQGLIRPGGLLLTGQDPRSVAKTHSDAVLAARRLKKPPSPWNLRQRIHASALWGDYWRRFARVVRRVAGMQGGMTPLAQEANSMLITNGVIRQPMDETSLYTVTDVHVPRRFGKGGSGIDEDDLQKWMTDMTMVAVYTYRFHDADFLQLTPEQREQELAWWQANDPHGASMATVFQKTPKCAGVEE